MNRAAAGPVLIALLVLLAPGVTAGEAEDWAAVQSAFDAAFVALPVKQMFTDLDEELRLSRRAPYTGDARTEIEKARAKQNLRREQILAERLKREAIVHRVAALGGTRATGVLIEAYDRCLKDVDAAFAAVERHLEALRVDINPGVDPGGVYWERWVRDSSLPAARRALVDEQRLRDLVLAECVKLKTPEVRTWLVANVGKADRPDVRERAAGALASSGDPADAAELGRILAAEREVWARSMLLDAIGTARAAGAAPSVLAALADSALPVRSAAVAALRAMGLRDTAAVSALVAALGAAGGRLSLEIRDALVEATGQPFGMLPGEWNLWWGANRESWTPPAGPAKVAPPAEGLPRFFGIPTASKRIVFIVARGPRMADPVKRRPLGNDGNPAPPPQVDTALKIAAWELSETLAGLPADAEFTVIVHGPEVSIFGKGLVRPSKENRQNAFRFVSKFAPDGSGDLAAALGAALRLGAPAGVSDLALAGAGDVDTIFIVGEPWIGAGNLGGPESGTEAVRRLARYRRVVIHAVTVGGGGNRELADLAAATGGTSRSADFE